MRLALTVIVTATLVLAGQAEAHLVTQSKKGQPLNSISKSQKRNLKHSKYVCKNGRHRTKNWHCKSLVWLRKEHKETKKELYQQAIPSTSLGPLNCISCWDAVARCESRGYWSYNGSSGFDGGLQFLPSTWLAYGGAKFAPYAYLASRMQQISIASYMSLGHWPVCGSKY